MLFGEFIQATNSTLFRLLVKGAVFEQKRIHLSLVLPVPVLRLSGIASDFMS